MYTLPFSIQRRLIYLFTKNGYLSIYHLDTLSLFVDNARISKDSIFGVMGAFGGDTSLSPNIDNKKGIEGVICIDRSGKVMKRVMIWLYYYYYTFL